MKKIIRLTESDLMRLVKRVINEQEAVNAVNKLRNKNDVTEFENEIKRKTNMKFCDYFNDEMSTLTRKPFNTIQSKLKELGLYCKADSWFSDVGDFFTDDEESSY